MSSLTNNIVEIDCNEHYIECVQATSDGQGNINYDMVVRPVTTMSKINCTVKIDLNDDKVNTNAFFREGKDIYDLHV